MTSFDFLTRRVSRRRLLGSAAAVVVAAPLLRLTPEASAAPGWAIKVLVHDELQDTAAFSRGRLRGASVRNGLLQGTGGFESEVIASPFPFTHVGLHWRGTGADQRSFSFEIRTSEDGSRWSEWHSLHIEALPSQTPAGETFASLVGASRHNFVQYRADLTGDARVGGVTATFLNSQDGPTVQTSAVASSVPSVIDFTREGWDCDESLRFRGRNEIWPRMFVPVKNLVVHHTAGRNDYSPAEAAGEVRAVYTYHARTLGWGDIGYNVLIDRFGNSYEGRYGRDLSGGREVFSPDVVAGHALAHNYGSCGASLIGNFDTADASMSDVMIGRLLDVLEYRASERQIDPAGGPYPFLRSDNTWNPSLMNVCGHLDTTSTACPGQNVYALLGAMRTELGTRLSMPPAPQLSGPGGDTLSSNQLSYGWTPPEGTEAVDYYLEGWFKSPSSEPITYLSGFDSARYPVWQTAESGQISVTFPGLTDGHYTMHVLAHTSAGVTYQTNKTVLLEGTSSGGGNTEPVVSIANPTDGASFSSGQTISFSGSATDAEDGDLTSSLAWTSDRDGPIGTGGGFSRILSDGDHELTATATDSGGATSSASVNVSVGAVSTGSINLTGSGSKVRGVKTANLSWTSSGVTGNFAIFRDGINIETVENSTRSFTDTIGRGSGSHTYQVVSGEVSSNSLILSF